MAFEISTTDVRRVCLGERSALVGDTLHVHAAEFEAALREADDRIRAVRVHLAEPGSATRIVCVKDVVQPRVKIAGERLGEGRVHAITGVAVATCGPIVGFQEGIIDMSGPGAAYSAFSALHLLVLEITVDDALAPPAHEEVLRTAGLRAAALIAEEARAAPPEQVETFDSAPAPALPRVGYVYLVLSQGLLHDTWVLGEKASRETLPRVFTPEELLDDAIVSGNCVSACDKNTTYHHQNNPVLRALLRRHGTDISFERVILSIEATRLGDKARAAERVIALAVELELEGVVISKEGFGNPDADLMMIVRGLEQAGIRTVCITDEYAGRDGSSQSLADATPEADAVVSTGNANEVIVLPPMARTIGPSPSLPRLAGSIATTVHADGGLEVELQALMGATNEMGLGRLRAREV